MSETCTEEAEVICHGDLFEKENLAGFCKRLQMTRKRHNCRAQQKNERRPLFKDCYEYQDGNSRSQNQVQVWRPVQLHRSHACEAGPVGDL